jgi:putative ABC transport system ATP-binding protein
MTTIGSGHDGRIPILRTENLTHQVGDLYLVEDLSVKISAQEVVAIAGPSGAGKSSFLRLLNRLDEPTNGTVFYKGQDYREIEPRWLRQQIGMLLQSPNLFPGTVADNLRFGPQQRGEGLTQKKIDALLEQVGLASYAERDVNGLSGGEAQRVSLARTLANSPQVLLLDEPTSALDQASEREVEQLILEIVREGALTCLIVTHDMEQAARIASHVILMKNGRLVKSGTIKEVLHA